jgi:hypothetical protein
LIIIQKHFDFKLFIDYKTIADKNKKSNISTNHIKSEAKKNEKEEVEYQTYKSSFLFQVNPQIKK